MSQKIALASDIVATAVEDLIEQNLGVTPHSVRAHIWEWIQMYDDVPPKNKIEVKVLDAMHTAADLATTFMHMLDLQKI